jgi:hypothetical protein
MLDDLRNSSAFLDDEETETEEEQAVVERPARRRKKEPFLGMTAQQRFLISLMLFMMVCVLGVFTLILTDTIVLPF